MIRIAMVEDDPACRAQLQEYIDRYSGETGEAFRVYPFGDGDEIVNGYRAGYDIIFMDIQMEFLDGMTAAQEIRRLDSRVIIIFITSLASCAVKGYTVDALDYILKPVPYCAFSRSMSRAMERLKRKRRYLFVQHRDGIQRVDCDRVYYIEVDGRSLVYHTADGDVVGVGALREVEDSLAQDVFFRCGKGCMVNLEHVSGVRDGDALVHGATVQVSRSRRKAFLDALNRCVNEVGP